jgi:hypothetical protein
MENLIALLFVGAMIFGVLWLLTAAGERLGDMLTSRRD